MASLRFIFFMKKKLSPFSVRPKARNVNGSFRIPDVHKIMDGKRIVVQNNNLLFSILITERKDLITIKIPKYPVSKNETALKL